MNYSICNKFKNTLNIKCSLCKNNYMKYSISIDEYFKNVEYYNNWKCRDCAINQNIEKKKIKLSMIKL